MMTSATERSPPIMLPDILLEFSHSLKACTSTEACWALAVDLLDHIQLDHVAFIYHATADGASTTLEHRTGARRSQDLALGMGLRGAPFSPEVLMQWRFDTPVFFGAAFFDDPALRFPFSPQDEARIVGAAAQGWRSVVAVPLRWTMRDGDAIMIFGSALGRAPFVTRIGEIGWTLHAFSLHFKEVYLAHKRREAVEKLGLTPRQLKLLPMMAEGMPTKQIAHLNGVTEQAVSKMMRKIGGHLGVSTRVGIVARSARLGILDVPVPTQRED